MKRLQLRHTICSSHCWLGLATQLLGCNRPNRHVRPLKVMFCLWSPADAAWWVWHGHGQGWTAQSKRFWQLSRSWCLLLTLVCDSRRFVRRLRRLQQQAQNTTGAPLPRSCQAGSVQAYRLAISVKSLKF